MLAQPIETIGAVETVEVLKLASMPGRVLHRIRDRREDISMSSGYLYHIARALMEVGSGADIPCGRPHSTYAVLQGTPMIVAQGRLYPRKL